MDNHVHILLREASPGKLPQIMRRVLTAYAGWLKRKYQRSGALVSNRYRSECVTDYAYLPRVMRYIHQNPVAAGLAKSASGYRWSSYNAYLRGTDALVTTDFALDMLASSRAGAKEAFVKFHQGATAGGISVPEGKKRSDQEVMLGIRSALGGIEPTSLPALKQKAERNSLLAMLREKGYSIRQIERATGVPRNIVAKCRPLQKRR
jgi:hypothetical protein